MVPVKVSVSIITYNQEKYIAQAIESVLMQETNFDFEIVIGEDDSTDNTRLIVKEYQEKYPEKIRLFLNDRKDVIYINGRPTGLSNFINNLKNCRGEYIAILEGDDYWTDPLKLQKQVEFLDNHHECILTFHGAQIKSEESGEFKNYFVEKPKEFTGIKDLLTINYIPTCSVFFRNHIMTQLPDWFSSLAFADWPLYILLAQHGEIGFLPENMSVYRVHREGYWSGTSPFDRNLNTLAFRETINAYLNYQYNDTLLKFALDEWQMLLSSVLQSLMTQGESNPDKEILKLYINHLRNNYLPYSWKIGYKTRMYQEIVHSSWVNGRLIIFFRYLWRLILLHPLLLMNTNYWKIGIKGLIKNAPFLLR